MHSTCFRGGIRKILIWIFLFSGAMWNVLCVGRSGQTLLTYSKLITSFSTVDSSYFEIQGTL